MGLAPENCTISMDWQRRLTPCKPVRVQKVRIPAPVSPAGYGPGALPLSPPQWRGRRQVICGSRTFPASSPDAGKPGVSDAMSHRGQYGARQQARPGAGRCVPSQIHPVRHPLSAVMVTRLYLQGHSMFTPVSLIANQLIRSPSQSAITIASTHLCGLGRLWRRRSCLWPRNDPENILSKSMLSCNHVNWPPVPV